MRLRSIAFFAAFLTTLASQSALAGFIQIGGDQPCTNDSCFGGVYTLGSELLSSDATTETHRITYTLDLSGYTGSQPSVTGLAYHVTNDPNFVSVAEHESPTGGDWDVLSGNIAQCGSGNNAGWVCLELDMGDAIATGSSTIYSWVSDLTVLTDGLIDNWSIQADFDPHRGMYLSESASVPIPGALWLFGSALGLLGFRARFQKKTSTA